MKSSSENIYVFRDGVKDEEEKVDMEFNKCNTNTQQIPNNVTV